MEEIELLPTHKMDWMHMLEVDTNNFKLAFGDGFQASGLNVLNFVNKLGYLKIKTTNLTKDKKIYFIDLQSIYQKRWRIK